MKSNADDIVKALNGLAIAAKRARQLAEEHGGKAGSFADLPRRQRDAARQHLLEIEVDVKTVLRVMTS